MFLFIQPQHDSKRPVGRLPGAGLQFLFACLGPPARLSSKLFSFLYGLADQRLILGLPGLGAGLLRLLDHLLGLVFGSLEVLFCLAACDQNLAGSPRFCLAYFI